MLEAEQHHSQALPDLVVQFTRDPCSLTFLSRQRMGGAGAALRFEPVEHGVERLDQVRQIAARGGIVDTNSGAQQVDADREHQPVDHEHAAKQCTGRLGRATVERGDHGTSVPPRRPACPSGGTALPPA